MEQEQKSQNSSLQVSSSSGIATNKALETFYQTNDNFTSPNKKEVSSLKNSNLWSDSKS